MTAPTPLVRAQELRFAWERFIADDDDGDTGLVREAITDSWKRSSAAGVDPTGSRRAPVIHDENETHDRYEEHPLHTAAPMIHECLSAIADEAGYLIVISDADGTLMSIEGTANMRLRAAADMNFAEGTSWSEGGAGTNAIGTALALDHAVQVFGPEHYADPVQRWTCSACPIHDPDTGAVIGVIDLTGELSTVHPHSLAVATATARAVEASLQLALQERDARLHARYGARVSPDRSALVTRTGRTIGAVPRGWKLTGRLAIPPGGGELMLPSGAHAVAEPVDATLEAFVVHALESKRVTSIARPLVKLRFLGRDRAELDTGEKVTDAAPAPGRDPRAAVLEPGRDERRAPVRRPARGRRLRRPPCASRSPGSESSSARGSTPSATASRATWRPTCAASRASSPPATSAAPPRPTPARCCRAARRPASRASARSSTLAPPGRDDVRGPRSAVELPAVHRRTISGPGSGC